MIPKGLSRNNELLGEPLDELLELLALRQRSAISFQWAAERTMMMQFFLAVVAASMILKGLTAKTVGHLGLLMAASNKTKDLVATLCMSGEAAFGRLHGSKRLIPRALAISTCTFGRLDCFQRLTAKSQYAGH
jgi:hypothetical protein